MTVGTSEEENEERYVSTREKALKGI